jgi:glycosyltransferase involved in cell wall biosynthesis
VTWHAEIGGAETLALALAQRFARFGAEPELVIIGRDGPLTDRLRAAGMPYRTLGFGRGREILLHPRRLAREVAAAGPDGVLIGECGYLGVCLRLGGYGAAIVASEHGIILFPSASRWGRARDWLLRASGAWADDAEVAVSDLVLERMRRYPHARRLGRIHDGVDPDAFAAPADSRPAGRSDHLVAGFAGRFWPGKGLHVLLPALARARLQASVSLRIAGDGPERAPLEALARELGVADHVEFLGMVSDVREFWAGCDIAVVPSNWFTESFCLSAVEAAACCKPVIATRNGALPEVVREGVTGVLVAPGEASDMAQAMVAYARDPELRRSHAMAARPWMLEHFTIDRCARAYLSLFDDVDREHRRGRWPSWAPDGR